MAYDLVALYRRFVKFNEQANNGLRDGFDGMISEDEFVRRFQEAAPAEAERLRKLLAVDFDEARERAIDEALAKLKLNH